MKVTGEFDMSFQYRDKGRTIVKHESVDRIDIEYDNSKMYVLIVDGRISIMKNELVGKP